jgi:sugar phosphate isomerase/epimerase
MKPVVGAQLFTLREHTKTIPDIIATLKKVKDIGYTAGQVSAFGKVDMDELTKVLNDSGLTIGATHISWDRFLNDLDAVIAQHKAWGCKHPAIGGLPEQYRSLDGIKRFVDELAPVAEKLAAEGMDLSYHNHNHELAKYDGRMWLEALYETAKPEQLKAEIDTYWIQAGGGDPTAWIKKCAGREPVIHLKDMCVTSDREVRMAEIGEGNLNWADILPAAEAGGVEYMFVEQDRCYDRDPFECLAISYRNLKAMGYQ